MYCLNCGYLLEPKEQSCPQCGAAAPQRAAPEPAVPEQQHGYQRQNDYPPGQQPGYQRQNYYPPGQQPGYPPPRSQPSYVQQGAPAQPGWNLFAILGFVLTVFPLMPFAGLVLSIIGIVECKKKGERGRGLAIAGIVLNVVIFLAAIAFFALALLFAVAETEQGQVFEGNGDGYFYFESSLTALTSLLMAAA
ncbi:MAG: DUF4190 domain-containing protein [Oscillospiraceae bacterium]|jgi:hypothetical protein|nr:DUF4190 domain-containing protein [Oscillospiraceae bacterium]